MDLIDIKFYITIIICELDIFSTIVILDSMIANIYYLLYLFYDYFILYVPLYKYMPGMNGANIYFGNIRTSICMHVYYRCMCLLVDCDSIFRDICDRLKWEVWRAYTSVYQI